MCWDRNNVVGLREGIYRREKKKKLKKIKSQTAESEKSEIWKAEQFYWNWHKSCVSPSALTSLCLRHMVQCFKKN